MSKDKWFSDLNNGSANYNTYSLGREGYFSLNLVTTNQALPSQKPIASYLLGSLAYGVGKRYEDFVASTDHIAEYGLAALIGGVAVKKAGWLALMAAFFAKSAKAAVLIAGTAIFGLLKAITGIFKKRAATQSSQQ